MRPRRRYRFIGVILPLTTLLANLARRLSFYRLSLGSFVAALAVLAVLGTASAVHAGAKPSKPNVLVILADDMGFSDAGCYGGEIHTPNIDRLASRGLRFTQFYNTARCWPTRSALLTGYYPQQIRMDPPHDRLPPWARLAPHYLKPLGYRCYHSGKWHVLGAPKAMADGGFDRSLKIDDQDRYFNPKELSEDDRPLPPVPPGTDFYLTTCIADHAIRCLKEHAAKHAGQPFFEYLAFTSPHFPLHALRKDIDRYRDRYTEGWDEVRHRRWQRLREMGIVNCGLAPLDGKLQPRYFQPEFLKRLGPGEVKMAVAWDTLSDEQKRFQATKMAIHAAMVDRMDQEIGRVLDQLRAMDAMDDTVIFFLSDNGADATILIRGDGHDPAAAPGSAGSFLCIGPGWASASNAPFRRHKIWVSEGGISTPLVVHWPKGIAGTGQLRHPVGHVIDLLPTIVELAGGKIASAPGGPAIPGRSLVPLLARDGGVVHDCLFFKHEGNRALRLGDWKLVSAREDADAWQLLDLSKDRCEAVDLAAPNPERVREMTEKWCEMDERFARQAK